MANLSAIQTILNIPTAFTYRGNLSGATIICTNPLVIEPIITDEKIQFSFDLQAQCNTSDMEQIGFDFTFFGIDYDMFHISSKGFITFSDLGEDGCCGGEILPTSSGPSNLIAFNWDDLDPEHASYFSFDLIMGRFFLTFD